MPIILPHGLASEEIRVLQEFRRLNRDTLPLETIKAVKHPAAAAGGEKPAVTLVSKGFLTAEGDSFTVTARAKEFLSVDAAPAVVETSAAAASAAENPEADGV